MVFKIKGAVILLLVVTFGAEAMPVLQILPEFAVL
jgi:hypothetical protein